MKVCHICGYKAVTNQNLKTHVEAKHENIRNYSCNVCEAKFYNAVQLRNHVKGMLLLNFTNQTSSVIANKISDKNAESTIFI